MKGNGENVGEDKRKEERNDGERNGKQHSFMQYLREITPVLTGEDCSTYGRGLERISQYENESYRISFSNV